MPLSRLISLLILLLIIGYLGFHLYGLLAPPPLSVSSPPDGLTTSNKIIAIKGQTKPGVQVRINGSPILPGRAGNFEQLLVLSRGINTITVSAKKRYSRPAIASRQILILDGERISTSPHSGI